MADDGLTDAERETLLGRPVPQAPSAASTGAPPPRIGHALDAHLAERLTALHQAFARHWSSELSTQLRHAVRLRVFSVRETTRGELFTRLPAPRSAGILSAGSWPQKWLLAVEPAILFPMIDSLLGGGREASQPIRRPLTEIEQRLAQRLLAPAATALDHAWRGVPEAKFAFERVEADLQAAPADTSQPLVWITFTAIVGPAEGSLHLAMPLEHAVRWLAASAGSPEAPSAPGSVELVACLAELELTEEELASLAVGDVIATEQSPAAPIQVTENGNPKYQARLGSLAGRKAMEIEAVLPRDAADEQRDHGRGQ